MYTVSMGKQDFIRWVTAKKEALGWGVNELSRRAELSNSYVSNVLNGVQDPGPKFYTAGLHVYPHLFRHTGAVARLLRGMDLETLKLYLGHESITTTSKYLTALEDDDVQAVAQRTAPSEDYR
jgi:site-specific recombinase XerD